MIEVGFRQYTELFCAISVIFVLFVEAFRYFIRNVKFNKKSKPA
jgi:hypothetical protein